MIKILCSVIKINRAPYKTAFQFELRLNMRNIEIKAIVRNIDELIDKARTLSGSSGEIIKQHDTFYSVPRGRLKMRRFETGSAELIYYLRPDAEGPKLSSYEKSSIDSSSIDDLHNVLDKALGSVGTVIKSRHLFMVDQTRIHIDSVQDLGDFMELEVMLKPEQSIEEGETIAYKLMDDLGIQKEDLIAGAYTDLLKQKGSQDK